MLAVLQLRTSKPKPQDMARLRDAIIAFNQEHNLDKRVLPLTRQLREANRRDILAEIAQQGGRKRVASMLQLLYLDPRAGFPTIGLAAEALRSFAEQHQDDPHRAPSLAELRQAGRHDLASSFSKFEQARLLETAGMKPNFHGRKSKHRVV